MNARNRRIHTLLAGCTFALLLLPPVADAQPASAAPAQPPVAGREFPIGSLRRVDQLPAGRLRSQVEALPTAAQERAVQWLGSFHFTDQDLPALHADASGGILYACSLTGSVTTVEADTPPLAAAAVPVSPFPASLLFHSKPGAANVLYINFAGETVTNTQWNTEIARAVIPAVAFSTDTDLATFSDAEQLIIKRVWQRMAEDYAPFNIDVTTERPASFTSRTAMALITRTTDANGEANPYSTAGGVAYVNVFGTSSYATYRPAWIYHNNLANDESFIAEAASHEIGHNMGLSHDGKTDGTEYYGGHGTGDISWGPLMGTGYYRNVSQWSKGEYYLANNTQDDLATIAGKLTYRTDDHGGTPGTATALAITGRTNVVSTTPENDPANSTTANKGILDRNTDVDVFSFVTGDGLVSLTVNPWITPAGTRGGNVDILAELYNEAGTLLLASNPALQTTALIQTNLAQGRYYLYVKNSAAGDPLSATPTGYTVYGSIGQFFINGYIPQPTAYIAPPVAELSITDLTQSGQATKSFTVAYSDDMAIDVSTVDSSDIRVTGPNGYNQLAQFVSLNVTGDGTPRTATYSILPPSGVWLPADNGTYTLWMQANQVGDTEGAFVGAGQLGQFNVAVPVAIYSASMDVNPGWTLDPEWEYGTPAYTSGGPTSGFTGTKIIAYNLDGDYANRLSAKYATTPAINCAGASSLDLRFKRWLRIRPNDPVAIQVSTNGTSWLNVWSSSSAVSDASWQEVQYALPASVAGSSTVRLRWSLASSQMQSDIGWNIDDVEVLANGALDTTPPASTLSVANVSLAGSPSHSCSVTYTDATAVRLSSLDATDLLVTGPNGYSNLVEFIGADLPADGSPITATYSIPAPGGAWDAVDNGTYTVTLEDAAVADTLNNVTPQATLGSFSVALSTAEPGLLVISPASGLTSSGSAGGPFSPATINYTLTNAGGSTLSWTASKSQDWVSLSATSGSLAAGGVTTVTVSINAGANSLVAGVYEDTVLFVNTATGSGNTGRSISLSVTSPGLLAVVPASGLTASGSVGGPFSPSSIIYTLTNSGGTTLSWTAGKTQNWVNLSATNGTLLPGSAASVTVSFNATANSLPAGGYTDSLAFVNTTTGAGNTTRSVSLTIFSAGQLAISPYDGLVSSGTVGGPFSPAAVVYTLTNSGGTPLSWTASKTQDWVSFSETSGTLSPGTAASVTVSLNTSANSLTAGSYSDSVSFVNATSGSGNTSRSVSLTVNSPGLLAVSPAGGLTSSGMVGGPFSPSSIIYTLTNSGGTTLNWTASKTQDWITLSATSGTLSPGSSTTVAVSLNSGASSLAAGSYTDSVSFVNATTGNGSTTRFVSLTINSAGHLLVLPADDLAATGSAGGPFTPSSITYTLTNSGGTSLNWTASKSQEWVSLSAMSGTLAAGNSTMITASINANAESLNAGTYGDTLNFVNTTTGNGNTSRSVSLEINSVSSVQLALPPVWRWSNPLPHGANIVDQATIGPVSVQVGERGQIFTSDDWGLWWPRDSHTTAALRGATFFGGRLVVTGEAGTVLFADRFDQFYLLNLGTTDWLESVAASPSRVVAVGDNAAIYTSTNAVVWQRVTGLPFTKWLRSVAYGGDMFVTVGEGGLIATSTDGSTWQTRTSNTTTNLNRVAWIGDHFLVVGEGGMMLTNASPSQWLKATSGTTNHLYGLAGSAPSHVTDGNLEVRLSESGSAWVSQLSTALAMPAPAWTYYTALYNSNYFLLSGRTGMNVAGVRTNGGVQWQASADSVRTWLWSVMRTPSHYVAVGDYGTILSSPNGIDWDWELVPTSATNSVLLGVGGSSNLLLAVGSQGTVLWGTNSFVWHALPAPTVNDLQGVCFDGQQFILAGGNGTILTSPNGTNWTTRSTPTTKFLMSVAPLPGGLVAVGDGGVILTSTNRGTDWAQRTSGTTDWLSQVRWLNDRLVAVGENGAILTSFNGMQWRTNASGTTAWLNAAEYVDGAWFAVGNQGTVLGSPDTTNWYSFGTLTKKSLYGAALYGGQLIAVGTEGVIVRSQLVPNLTPIHIAGFSRSSGMNVFLFNGVADQRFALESSADLFNWSEEVLLEFLDSTGTLLWVTETGANAPPVQFYRTRLIE